MAGSAHPGANSSLETVPGAERPVAAELAERYARVLQKLRRGFAAAAVRKPSSLKAKR